MVCSYVLFKSKNKFIKTQKKKSRWNLREKLRDEYLIELFCILSCFYQPSSNQFNNIFYILTTYKLSNDNILNTGITSIFL